MADIRRWLEQHGLDKYSEVFAENAVDVDVLPELTEEHFKALGVAIGCVC
jgi:hypothetical protein